MPSRRTEAGDFNAHTRPGSYTLCAPPRGHNIGILVAVCPRAGPLREAKQSQAASSADRDVYKQVIHDHGVVLGEVKCLETCATAANRPHKTFGGVGSE